MIIGYCDKFGELHFIVTKYYRLSLHYKTTRIARLLKKEIVLKQSNLLKVLLPERIRPLPCDLVEAVLAAPPVKQRCQIMM